MIIEVKAYFAEHHVGSSHELQKIIAENWPVLTVKHSQANSLDGVHSATCSDCMGEIAAGILAQAPYQGKHRN